MSTDEINREPGAPRDTALPYIAHKRVASGQHLAEIQALETHLLETGELAASVADKIGLSSAGRLLGLLHDFGKYSAQFQNYIKSGTGTIDQDDEGWVDAELLRGKIDHSTAGAQYVWSLFSRYGRSGQGELVGQIMALCIASHHSGLIDCFDKTGKPKFVNRLHKPDELTHFEECKKSAEKSIINLVNDTATERTCADLLRVVKDVTGKAVPFSTIAAFNLGFLTRFLFSALIDADRLNSAEFENPWRKSERMEKRDAFNWQIAIERVEGFFANLTPRHPIDELRSAISINCLEKSRGAQGIYTLSVPTGGGKTYASLRYAVHHAAEHNLDRIIYIVPFTSIIEQNAKEIRKVIEKESDAFPWVLENHSNLEPAQQTWKTKLVSENWDSPIVLTTMVQFLEACFAGGTRSVRRLHQLANSVIIFDEIQTLPINCTHIFCNSLNFLTQHCHTSALLCTATQPLLDKLKNPEKGQLFIPAGNEIVDDTHQLFADLNRVNVVNHLKPKGWSVFEIAELALTQYVDTRSCLIIVNTKNWAQELYKNCSDSVPNDALFHLSTNQCPAHRKVLLGNIRQRLKDKLPVLCISTQLIEAGVDVSFGSVIRFLAGLDSIAQAAGRCNRHGEAKDLDGNPAKGQVYIVNPDSEPTELLKDIEAGKEATMRLLHDGFENLVAPEAVAQYFRYYFYDRTDDMSYTLEARKLGRDDTLLNLLSNNNECPGEYANRPDNMMPLLRQSFMEAGKQFNAIDAPTKALIVPYGEGKKIIAGLCAVDKEFNAGKYYGLLKQAQQYSVNVFPNVWHRLIQAGAVHEAQSDYAIFHLDERHYHSEFGLSEAMVNLMQDCSI